MRPDVTTATLDDIGVGDSTAMIERARIELYHQINFLQDLASTSSAIADCLTPVEDDGLDDVFAKLNGDLLCVADHVAKNCSESLDSCKSIQMQLEESKQGRIEVDRSIANLCQSADGIK